MIRLPERFTHKAFTLIELLIVVAIIGILAAIAVPNFLNARIRAKVARVEADLHAVTVAIGSYVVDNNDYIPSHHFSKTDPWILNHLTTPVAYINDTRLPDPFAPSFTNDDNPSHYFYMNMDSGRFEGVRDVLANPDGSFPPAVRRCAFMLGSAGPDGWLNYDNPPYNPNRTVRGNPPDDFPFSQFLEYSTTNGVISYGDIYTYGT